MDAGEIEDALEAKGLDAPRITPLFKFFCALTRSLCFSR